MPVYDYDCPSCGPFTEMRPMALSAEPTGCPQCGGLARRVILRAPCVAGISAARRKAFETNERSAHEPKLASKVGGHGAGCSCCSGRKKRSSVVYTADGAKTFPSRRPWMIGH